MARKHETRETKVLRAIAKAKMMTANSYVILRDSINIDRGYNAYRVEGRKPAICAWEGCTHECTCNNGSVKVILPNARLGVTLCCDHASRTECYSSENYDFSGKITNDGITCSCELETSDNTAVSRATLGQTNVGFGCMPTSDSSLRNLLGDPVEWKTKVYHSTQGATKLFGAFEALLNEGYIEMNDNCGSHLHTGLSDGSIDFRHLFKNVDEYFEAFGKVYDYLDKMPNAKMKEYFGRGFVGYSRTLRKTDNGYVLPKHNGNGKNLHSNEYLSGNDNLYGTGSYNCTQHLLTFNLQHSYSIEFRLARFTNATMYRKIAVVMHNVVIYLRDYYNNEISLKTLGLALEALFKEAFPY